MSSLDTFVLYEKALRKLSDYLKEKNDNGYNDFLVLEARLIENIFTSRLYSDSSETRHDRNTVIAQLNTICLRYIGITFNELCATLTNDTSTSIHPSPNNTLKLGQIITDYTSQQPLLSIDSVLPQIKLSSFSPAHFGFFHWAEKPKTISELQVINFKADYYIDFSVYTRMINKYILRAEFIPVDVPLFPNRWLHELQSKRVAKVSSFFDDTDYFTSLDIKEIPCPSCNSSSGQACVECAVGKWRTFTSNCISTFAKKFTILDACLNGTKLPEKSATSSDLEKISRNLYTSETYNSLVKNFQVSTPQLSQSQRIIMSTNYNDMKINVQNAISNNLIDRTRNPLGISTHKQKLFSDAQAVELGGFRTKILMTSVYCILYTRTVKYKTGVINKSEKSAEIKGEIWLAGDGNLSPIYQQEKIN